MPIYVDPIVSTISTGVPAIADAGIVRAGIPTMDDCKILTRLKAFIVDQGVCSTIEHVFRNREGKAVDLSEWLGRAESESGSLSESTVPAGTCKVRIKRWGVDGNNPSENPIYDIYGDVYDASKGILRFTLEPKVVEHAGIYELSFAVLSVTGSPLAIDRGIMSVERSMFALDTKLNRKQLGPPTIQEVRMRLMDSSRNENLLLDDIEFKDEQILNAMGEPVRLWNETPPPIERFSTHNFPFHGAWITGVLAQLHMTMANHFRRNVFRTATGGTSDKDKEREYMAEGQRLWQEYQAWVVNKKVEINLKKFAGTSISAYSTRTGW